MCHKTYIPITLSFGKILVSLENFNGISFTTNSETASSLRTYTYNPVEDPVLSTWPTIEDFYVELGAQKIKEYLSQIDTENDWTFIVNFLRETSKKLVKLYDYEVRFLHYT